jgi:hypothetical protein
MGRPVGLARPAIVWFDAPSGLSGQVAAEVCSVM